MNRAGEGASEFGAKYFEQLKKNESEGDFRMKEEHQLILRHMSPRPMERILDVGCGKGRLGLFLLETEPNIDMVFSDVSEEAARYLEGKQFVRSSMADMPFPDNSFDKIFCLHVLSHVDKPAESLKEAFRILKPGGKLMILTPNWFYVTLARIAARIRLIPRYSFDPTARTLYSMRSLKAALSKYSWTSMEGLYFQPTPRCLPFEWMRAKVIVIATK